MNEYINPSMPLDGNLLTSTGAIGIIQNTRPKPKGTWQSFITSAASPKID